MVNKVSKIPHLQPEQAQYAVKEAALSLLSTNLKQEQAKADIVNPASELVAAQVESITINPLAMEYADPLHHKIMAQLLEKIDTEPGKKLRRSQAINPKKQQRYTYPVEIEGKKYDVNLTRSIRASSLNGEKIYYIMTLSTIDKKKYIVEQKIVNKHAQAPESIPQANCSVVNVRWALVKNQDSYSVRSLSQKAVEVSSKSMVAKILVPPASGKSRVDELTREHGFQRIVEKQRGQQGTHDEVLVSNINGHEKSVMLMPLLEGVNGAIWSRQTRGAQIENRLRFQVARDLIDDLLSAHTAGIIHRDLKPANIMVSDERHTDDTGKIIINSIKTTIADWGLARKKDDVNTNNNVGTPLYIPPESISFPQFDSLDEKSDVFSFGATLAVMPFGARQSAVTATRNQLWSSRNVDALNATYDFGQIKYQGDKSIGYLLQAVFEGMTAKSKADRPDLQWCRAFFDAMYNYEIAHDDKKNVALENVIQQVRKYNYLVGIVLKNIQKFDVSIKKRILPQLTSEEVHALIYKCIQDNSSLLRENLSLLNEEQRNILFQREFSASYWAAILNALEPKVAIVALNKLPAKKQMLILKNRLNPQLASLFFVEHNVSVDEQIIALKYYENEKKQLIFQALPLAMRIDFFSSLNSQEKKSYWRSFSAEDKLIFQGINVGIDLRELVNINTNVFENDPIAVLAYRYVSLKIKALYLIRESADDNLKHLIAQLNSYQRGNKEVIKEFIKHQFEFLSYTLVFSEFKEEVLRCKRSGEASNRKQVYDQMRADYLVIGKVLEQCREHPFLNRLLLNKIKKDPSDTGIYREFIRLANEFLSFESQDLKNNAINTAERISALFGDETGFAEYKDKIECQLLVDALKQYDNHPFLNALVLKQFKNTSFNKLFLKQFIKLATELQLFEQQGEKSKAVNVATQIGMLFDDKSGLKEYKEKTLYQPLIDMLISTSKITTPQDCKKYISDIKRFVQELFHTGYFSDKPIVLATLNAVIGYVSEMPIKKDFLMSVGDFLKGNKNDRVKNVLTICNIIGRNFNNQSELTQAIHNEQAKLPTGIFWSGGLSERLSYAIQAEPMVSRAYEFSH